MMSFDGIMALVNQCRYESNLDIQIDMLYKINEQLPSSLRIKIPSLLTNDYLARALDVIEEEIVQGESSVSVI